MDLAKVGVGLISQTRWPVILSRKDPEEPAHQLWTGGKNTHMHTRHFESHWQSSDVNAWTESESVSSFEETEPNVESLDLEVIGANWSGEMVSLFPEDWELARVASSCHLALNFVPGSARGVPGEPTLTVCGSLSHL